MEIARRYDREGADELTFLDITASSDNRDIILSVIEAVASQVFIPLTVGGGVRQVSDIRRLLNSGADKVSINTAGVLNPDLIGDSAALYGSQCIVAAIDARKNASGEGWEVFTHGGRKPTGRDAVEWAKEVERLEGRLRSGTHARGERCCEYSGDCLRRRREPAASRGRRAEGARGRGARRVDLPLR